MKNALQLQFRNQEFIWISLNQNLRRDNFWVQSNLAVLLNPAAPDLTFLLRTVFNTDFQNLGLADFRLGFPKLIKFYSISDERFLISQIFFIMKISWKIAVKRDVTFF